MTKPGRKPVADPERLELSLLRPHTPVAVFLPCHAVPLLEGTFGNVRVRLAVLYLADGRPERFEVARSYGSGQHKPRMTMIDLVGALAILGQALAVGDVDEAFVRDVLAQARDGGRRLT